MREKAFFNFRSRSFVGDIQPVNEGHVLIIANRMFNPVMNYDEYEELFKEYRTFTTGDLIVPVDTTSFDGVDFDNLMQIAVSELA